MDGFREWYQDESGQLSIKAATESAVAAVFVATCMGVFFYGLHLAITSWGFLLGISLGGILSAAAGYALFLIGGLVRVVMWIVSVIVIVSIIGTIWTMSTLS